MSGVSIVCFAASYTLTLVLEITRLFFRSGLRGAAMLALAGAGLFAHSVYLFYRAVNTAGSLEMIGGVPYSRYPSATTPK